MKALLFCSKKREVVPDLAPMLWHSFGTIAALLQEIITIYPAINPPQLTNQSLTDSEIQLVTHTDMTDVLTLWKHTNPFQHDY